jgi:hypothetical protein
LKTYKPATVPDDPANVPGFLRRELAQIQRSANSQESSFDFVVLHAEPAKTRAGMVVYADGTDWDPGSGEGIYRRNALNAAWVFVG